jgi:hypothetical protein
VRCGSRFLIATAIAAIACAATLNPLAAEKKPASYALIFGTVWGPNNQPIYGVRVKIGRAESKKASWELYSDHRGEFAQRVPPGPTDYVVWAEPVSQKHGPKLRGEPVKVHVEAEERQDVGLHLK